MIIGRLAFGFASKRVAPRASLGVLIAASVLLDLLWPTFLAAGWEQVRIDPGNTAMTPLDFVRYPISHSLVTACGCGVLFAGFYWAITHYARGAVIIWFGVVSHWFLHFVSHRGSRHAVFDRQLHLWVIASHFRTIQMRAGKMPVPLSAGRTFL